MNLFPQNSRLLMALLVSAAAASAATPPEAKARLRAQYGKLPLSFEENRGQAGSGVKYLSQGRGYAIWVTPGEVSFHSRQAAIRMSFAGAQPTAQVRASDRQQALSSYFVGSDPARWRTGIPNYARVRYSGLYPGIDLVLYGSQGQLEYDFVVAPGADPRAIQLVFQGVDGRHLDAAGDLILSTAAGEMRQHQPVVYQEAGGVRRSVEGRYILDGRRVRFQVAHYDTHRALIIDPTLSYLTYLGAPGPAGFDPVFGAYPGIALDAAGNAYVVTTTTSGNTNVQVNKLNANGTALLYSVNFGGGLADVGEAIAVDSAGNAYVTGVTSSTDFPVSSTAPQKHNQSTTGGNNAFVTKLNPTGGMVYSTYLGGSGDDFGRAIAIDTAGNAYAAGTAIEQGGTNFPVTAGVLSTSPGPGFLTKVNSGGTGFTYSTFLTYGIAYGVAVDPGGDAYVTGTTGASGGFGAAYVVSVNPTASALNYAPAMLGEPSAHQSTGYGIALDAQQDVYIAGMTNDPAFPVTSGVPQNAYGGGQSDGFAAKLSEGMVVYATYLGGVGSNEYPERASGVGVDAAGDAYVSGTTECIGFPNVNGIADVQGVRAPLAMSTNQGAAWTAVTGLMPPSSGIFDQVTALAFSPSGTIYAGTSVVNAAGGGIYKSTNGGTTWTLGTGIGSNTIDAIAVDPSPTTSVFAVAGGLIYQSTNSGATWSLVSAAPSVGTAASIVIPTGILAYVGSSTGLVTGINGVWTHVPTTTVPAPVNAVAAASGTVGYAATNSGVYMTSNGGTMWTSVSSGLPSLIVTSLAVDSLGNVYAATPAGVSMLPAGTSTWSSALPTNTVQTTSLVAVDPSNPMNLYVGLGGGGILFSTDGGTSFSSVTYNGLSHNTVQALGVQPVTGIVFAGNTAATDSFVVEIDPAGSSFVYATCMGGSDNDLGQSVAVTQNGAVFLSGATASSDLPVTGGSYQPTYDAFVAAIDVPYPIVQITYPEPQTTLSENSVTFSWGTVSGASQYQLNVGTTLGGTNIFTGTTTGTSQSVTGLPCNGAIVYVQVSARVGGVFQPATQYTYNTAANCTGVGDFNGDGQEDLVWQRTSTLQTNVNYYGGAGPQRQGTAVLNNSAGLNVWRVVGSGDFNHDGVPDLVWQNTGTGQVRVDYYGGPSHTTIISSAILNSGAGTAGWSVVAVADQNGDGNPDLIWQNSSSGQVNVNYYGGAGGAVLTGFAVLNSGAGTGGWHVVADADFDGNGIPDLVWQNTSTGQVNVNYYGGTGGAVLTGFAVLDSGAGTSGSSVVGAADMNANGVPDLIWENSTTAQVNVNYYGGAGGAVKQGSDCLNCGGNFSGLTVRALADFNGNGEPDLVVQDNTTGTASVYYYSFGGDVFLGWNLLNTGAGAAGWKVVATGDFDNNGITDLVWQNSSTGQVNLNYYGGAGGATLIGFAVLNSGAGTAGWSVVAAADFNGDGVPDLIWQNASSGQVNVNYYGGPGGATLTGFAVLNNGAGTAGWKVVAAADFDGNGTPDLIWQKTSSGQVNVNYYSGTTLTGYAVLNSGAGTAGWSVVGAADFDGNGVPDLVWQNTSMGQATVNYYGGAKGAVFKGWNYLNSAPNPGWRVLPARAR
jgi:FG-GAP-like repeat/Beta-propeller repeat